MEHPKLIAIENKVRSFESMPPDQLLEKIKTLLISAEFLKHEIKDLNVEISNYSSEILQLKFEIQDLKK